MYKIFIDGSAGTTGLRIRERLGERKDIELLILPEELRKDTSARAEMLNKSDVSFLCLPDAAAVEAVSLIDDPDTVVIDTSTAHRVTPAASSLWFVRWSRKGYSAPISVYRVSPLPAIPAAAKR